MFDVTLNPQGPPCIMMHHVPAPNSPLTNSLKQQDEAVILSTCIA